MGGWGGGAQGLVDRGQLGGGGEQGLVDRRQFISNRYI